MVRGRRVMDFLVDRMLAGGCTRLRVVTRPDKIDVIDHAQALGAEVVLARPLSVAASLAEGMEGLGDDDIALIGFPDTIWEPENGYELLVDAVITGCDLALGLFKAQDLERSDVVRRGEEQRIVGIDVKPKRPASEWIWGCAAGRVKTWSGLGQSEWPGAYIDQLCRSRGDVRGVELSDVWLDIGTREALQRA